MNIFKLNADLTTINNGEIEQNSYEQMLFVRLMKDNKQSAVVYNKELKMYFEDTKAFCFYFEIEIRDIILKLSKRLGKSKEFNRKLFYRYDWLQIKANSKGQVVSIGNKEEIEKNWQKLKSRLKMSHKGDYVDKYLDRVDLEFSHEIYPVINQYFQFGLLFPNIPVSHTDIWTGKRIIEFSPYEQEKFEEHIKIDCIENNKVRYHIEGKTLSDSKTEILNYSGNALKLKNEIFPQKISINTSINKDEIVSQWNFKLQQIK